MALITGVVVGLHVEPVPNLHLILVIILVLFGITVLIRATIQLSSGRVVQGILCMAIVSLIAYIRVLQFPQIEDWTHFHSELHHIEAMNCRVLDPAWKARRLCASALRGTWQPPRRASGRRRTIAR